MAVEFEPKNEPIVLKANGIIDRQVALVQNLYDKADDKINHFDRLRQQVLNYALLVFSGLLAFIMKTENAWMQVVGCFGIVVLMVIFRLIDYRYHRFTHGYGASKKIFVRVMAYSLDNPKEDVSFLQYHTPGEKKTEKWNLQTWIYLSLGFIATVLGVVIAITAIVKW